MGAQDSPPDPRVGLAQTRTTYATFRTQLALDRTTLAWIRTNLTMASFGLGMVAFFRALREQRDNPETQALHQGAIQFGIALVLLGLVSSVLAGISHWRTLRRLKRGEVPVLTLWPLSLLVSFLVALLGLAGLWLITHR